MNLYKNNEGMTLIELIVSMAITAIVISMIIMIISTAAHSFRRTNENVNLQQEAQLAINQLSNMAMEASAITKSTTTVSPNIKYILESSPYCYAVVFIAAEHRLYLIQATTLEAAKILVVNEDSALLAEYVKSITIDHTDRKMANIDITFELGNEQYSINKKVKLRNAK